jgi:IS30 family transposase
MTPRQQPPSQQRSHSATGNGTSPQPFRLKAAGIEIAGRLRYQNYRGETDMSISHEAIYTWIYAQPKGELARAGIVLRTGRERRKPRGRAKPKGAKIVGMVSIDDRPAEVAGRQVPGHLEGDLIIGKGGKSAVGTLVERVSRFTILVPLPNGHDAESTKIALFGAVKGLPGQMRKSLTWDQGTEMAQHGFAGPPLEVAAGQHRRWPNHPHSARRTRVPA